VKNLEIHFEHIIIIPLDKKLSRKEKKKPTTNFQTKKERRKKETMSLKNTFHSSQQHAKPHRRRNRNRKNNIQSNTKNNHETSPPPPPKYKTNEELLLLEIDIDSPNCASIITPAPASTWDFCTPVPLENCWSFWYDKYPGPNLSPKDYEEALHLIGAFDTVQGFWSYYNNLPEVAQIQMSCSMHLMKSGIRPLWEDDGNSRGGHLVYKVKKQQVNLIWRQILLNVIGEQFDPVLDKKDDICGASVSARKGDEAVVSLWNKEKDLFDLRSIDNHIHNILPPSFKLDGPNYRVNLVK